MKWRFMYVSVIAPDLEQMKNKINQFKKEILDKEP